MKILDRTQRVGAWLVAVVLLASCRGTSDVPNVDVSPVEVASNASATATDDGATVTPDQLATAMERAIPRIATAYRDGDLADLDAVVRVVTERRGAVASLAVALPAGRLRDLTTSQQEQWTLMRTSLEHWRDTVEDVAAVVTARRDDSASPDTAPPPEVEELLERDLEAASAYGDACAAFSDAVGLSVDCYPFLSEEAADAVQTYTVTIGDVTLSYDVTGVHVDLVDDGMAITFVETNTLAIGAPPEVTDPAQELHRDLDTLIPDPIPWPEDLAAWYAQLPVAVLDEGDVELGDEGQSWSWVVLEGTDPQRFALANLASEFAIQTGPDFEVVLWQTSIDGQEVVAVSDGRPDLAYEEHLALTQAILATIRGGG